MGERRDVVDLGEVDRTQVAVAGGKAAQLGELTRVDGVVVPPGVCVTTVAYRRVVGATPWIADLIDELDGVGAAEHVALMARAAAVRAAIDAVSVPADIAEAVAAAVERMGPDAAYAVRSSATAEDLPSASFAGQHDSFLGVVGPAEVLRHVVRCWASLFTDRAVAYRARHGIDHGGAAMAVVVQRMVDARAAGVLFTADPVSGHRRVATVEAVAGLGDALVAGRADAERFTVRDGTVASRRTGPSPIVADDEVLELVRLGRRIEDHTGVPQDVEWCISDDGPRIVQSRPITTLFPIPAADDDAGHVYVSVGHQQMMTDAMAPLGLSVWQMTTPRPMVVAGSRLFVDVTLGLAAPASRAALLDVFGRSDPLLRDALETVLERRDVVPSIPDDAGGPWPPPPTPDEPLRSDPALVAGLVARNRASVGRLREDLRARSGSDLLAAIRDDIPELRSLLFAADSHAVVMAAIESTWWLNERMEDWLGVTNAADLLTRSAPNNVTSEMGLALLDVADVVRPHAEVVAYLDGLRGDEGPEVLDELAQLPGGSAAADALRRFLDDYGMRCVGEIDITRPRWREVPGALAAAILGNVAAFAPGEAARRIERGSEEAARAAQELLDRVRALPDGDAKATETAAMIERLRTFIGYREYPKYGMVSRYALYREAVLEEADRLVGDGVLEARDDIYFLTFDELDDVVRTRLLDPSVVAERRQALDADRLLRAPRVLTSDGEALQGSHRRGDLAPGALAGIGVSHGTVQGRARVVLDVADAALEPGDILVTRFTDPSWAPLFVSIGGLVTEVGGVMTHGAVVAREYGLPAVVGVDGATDRIADGQRIRIDGTTGAVEPVVIA